MNIERFLRNIPKSGNSSILYAEFPFPAFTAIAASLNILQRMRCPNWQSAWEIFLNGTFAFGALGVLQERKPAQWP
jgi:hypothetical protein